MPSKKVLPAILGLVVGVLIAVLTYHIQGLIIPNMDEFWKGVIVGIIVASTTFLFHFEFAQRR